MIELRMRLLKAAPFILDGWTSARGREEATKMRDEGLITIDVRGSDEQQYTYLYCELTASGLRERDRLE